MDNLQAVSTVQTLKAEIHRVLVAGTALSSLDADIARFGSAIMWTMVDSVFDLLGPEPDLDVGVSLTGYPIAKMPIIETPSTDWHKEMPVSVEIKEDRPVHHEAIGKFTLFHPADKIGEGRLYELTIDVFYGSKARMLALRHPYTIKEVEFEAYE